MSNDLIQKAYGTLFPVTNELTPDQEILSFLDNGGKALLFGEYGDEYASGRMSPQRIAAETLDAWETALSGLRKRYGALMFACDADIAAVNRLHHVVGELPSREATISASTEQLSLWIEEYAKRVRALGMNLVLSPTADYVSPGNPWLEDRTLADDIDTLSRIVATFVAAARRGGLQTAIKHFPGHDHLSGIPAREYATVPLTREQLLQQAASFKAGIDAGTDAVVMGSAIFNGATPPESASLSADLITMLRQDLGFSGLVITLDLDHVSAQGSKTIEETCVAALRAGADLLLLSPASVTKIPAITAAIAHAVDTGELDAERLNAAANATLRATR